jgi:hypothetical protein
MIEICFQWTWAMFAGTNVLTISSNAFDLCWLQQSSACRILSTSFLMTMMGFRREVE